MEDATANALRAWLISNVGQRKNRSMRSVAILAVCLTGLLSICGAQGVAKPQRDALLEKELSAMAAADQRVRTNRETSKEEWEVVDARNLKRMKEVVAAYGWPGYSLVGGAGAGDAFLLVQHCDKDPKFQELCLGLLEKAVAVGEASPVHFAYLLDRVRTHQAKPQVFGTQFANGELYSLEDPEHVDERRRSVGLGPLKEYLDQMRRAKKEPNQ